MNTTTTTETLQIDPAYTQMELPQLADNISLQYERVDKAVKSAVDHAAECGRMLHAAKARVPHGSWMQWVEDNTTLPRSTAGAYMALASNYQRVGNMDSIRGALKLLADDRAEEKRQVSECYVPFDGEQVTTPPPASPSVKEAVLSGGPVIDVESSDTEPEPLVVDTTKDAAAPNPPADEPKKQNSRALLAAKKMIGRLDPEDLAEIYVWAETNRKKLVTSATRRQAEREKEQAEAAKRRADRELAKAASVTNGKEQDA